MGAHISQVCRYDVDQTIKKVIDGEVPKHHLRKTMMSDENAKKKRWNIVWRVKMVAVEENG